MKYLVVILLLLTFILSGCVDETRIIPDSLEFNEKFTFIKVNPDEIRFAFQPVINNNQIIYKSDKEKYYSYDINTKKTSKSNIETHQKATDGYHTSKYGHIVENGRNLIYKDSNTGKDIELTTGEQYIYDSDRHFGIGEKYSVWSEEVFGGMDKIYLMKLEDGAVREIEPSKEFIDKSGYYQDKPLFSVFELGVYKNKIIVQTMDCIYMYDANTLEETKIVCDNNVLTRMRLYDNKIVFQGNSANRAVDGYVNNDAFLVII